MRLRHLVPLVVLVPLTACNATSKTESTATSESKSEKKKDDKKDDAKSKKSGDAKAKADDSAAAKTSDSAAAKKDDAAVKPPASAEPASSGAAAAGAPEGLGGLFTGDVDPSAKFERQGQIPNEPVWMQILPYWKLNLDTPPDEEPYKDLVATGKDGHATIYLWIQQPNPAGLSPTDQSNHCLWSHVSECKFQPPVDGVLGQGIKVKIAEGTGNMMTKPAKVWWMTGDIEGGKQLVVFAALRNDVYPKLEDELKWMLRTVKVQHG